MRAGYEDFQRRRYFPELDGLRALSVLLVITAHVHWSLWSKFGGGQGVLVFFGLSGFLITTLLSRERDRGGVSLARFYIRRAFRILPLYLIVLGLYVALIVLVGDAGKQAGLEQALPYYLTFLNEIPIYSGHFHGATPFFQSWSLGVEEKFYVVWPVIAYALCSSARSRRHLVLALTGFVTAVQLATWEPWTRWYGAILVGCLLATCLNDRSLYERLRPLARPWLATLAFTAWQVWRVNDPHFAWVAFPWLVAWLILSLVVVGLPVARSRLAVFLGKRSYGIYLIHVLAIAAAERLTNGALPAYLLAVALAIAAADVLHRTVERPLIAVGRFLSNSPRRSALVLARSASGGFF